MVPALTANAAVAVTAYAGRLAARRRRRHECLLSRIPCVWCVISGAHALEQMN